MEAKTRQQGVPHEKEAEVVANTGQQDVTHKKEAELVTFKQKKSRTKALFTRRKNQLQELCKDDSSTSEELKGALDELEDAMDSYVESINVILDLLKTMRKTDELVKMSTELEDCERKYDEVVKEYHEAQAELKSNSSEQSVKAGNMDIGKDMWKQLQRVRIPIFYGDKAKYPAWKAAFLACVDVAPATPEYKLLQLTQHLRGEALKCVEELGHSAEAYETAKERLERKYGGERRQVLRFLDELDRFTPLKNENVKEIECFADLLDLAVIRLNQLDHKEDLADGSLYIRMMKKLPQSMLVRYNRWVFENKISESLQNLRKWVIQESEFAVTASETIHGLDSMNTDSNRHRSMNSDGNRTRNMNSDRKSTTSYFANNHIKCSVCDEGHHILNCKQFESMTCEERWAKAKLLKLCFRCLGKSHSGRNCRRDRQCGINDCRQNHHHLLHNEGGNRQSVNQVNHSSLNPEAPVFHGHEITTHSNSSEYIALRTVPIVLKSGNKSLKVNALLDDGSTKTYLNADVAAELGLQGEMQNISVKVLNDTVETFSTMSVTVGLESLDDSVKTEIEAQTLKSVTGSLKVIDWKKESEKYEHLKDVRFPTVPKKAKIDILIGLDYAGLHTSCKEIIGKVGEPVARLTPLGWTCVGPVDTDSKTSLFTFHAKEFQHVPELDQTLRQFWEIENEGINNKTQMSVDERQIFEDTEQSIELKENLYEVKVPWKEKKEQLPNNYSSAVKRLENTKKKLQKNEDLKHVYSETIEKYIEKGYVKKIENPETDKGWYLPHFPVIKPDRQTTKVRIVFDASAKHDQISLNDYIHPGPKLQQELYDVLLRFRKKQIALVCDIAEMYLQIGLDIEDQPYHRFLWRESPERPIETNQFTRVVFGVNASPFLAQLVSRHNAVLYSEQYPLATETVLNSTYMDDSMDSAETEQEAIEMYTQLSKLWGKANMKARKWMSNSYNVLKTIPEQDRAAEIDIESKHLPTTKALGMVWKAEDDTFTFKVGEEIKYPNELTKRNVLKTVAKIFDPLGFVAPFTVRGKVLMQELWLNGIDWDERVNEEISQKFDKWFCELSEMKNLEIPRCIRDENVEHQTKDFTLHIFVDASNTAYGATAYARCEYENAPVSVRIIAAKSKVAPLESTSVPRLELLAAMVGLRLAIATCGALNMNIEIVTFWSDSLNVLYWIRNQSRQFKTFVANRIGEIHRSTVPQQWRYVPSKENPADIVSRGMNLSELIDTQVWWQGPDFLKQDKVEWPENKVEGAESSKDENRKAKVVNSNVLFSSEQKRDDEWRLNPEHYSKWQKYVRVFAYVIRFIENCRVAKEYRTLGPLQVQELQDVEMKIVSEAQKEGFRDEYDRLSSGKILLKSSKLLKLNPKLDSEGVMRCDGRLRFAEYLPYDSKYPIILPRRSAVTELIVKYFHDKANHSGTNQTLSDLSNRYWIIAAREAIRECEHNCMECRRRKSKPANQVMAPLPKIRVDMPLRAFAHTAVDFAGPFLTKQSRGKSRQKRYLCLFTCLASHAVHLEVAFGLDTSSFLNAFYRMTNRRGLPLQMLSDNGTNFVAADKELKELVKQLSVNRDKVIENTANKGVKWQFNPPLAPHWGGVHEAMVKSAKRAIYAIIQKADVTDEELITAFSGAENLINSRPLTYQSANPTDCVPITPNHFLIGQAGGQFAPQTVDETQYNPVKRWRYVQEVVSHFWQRWLREWLPTLNVRRKWQHETKDLKIGDIVIVIMPDIPRGYWPLGRVTNIHTGRDGHVRAATLLVGKKEITRPIVKLCPLELNTYQL